MSYSKKTFSMVLALSLGPSMNALAQSDQRAMFYTDSVYEMLSKTNAPTVIQNQDFRGYVATLIKLLSNDKYVISDIKKLPLRLNQVNCQFIPRHG